jgi:phosphate transport system substrate-binding protein
MKHLRRMIGLFIVTLVMFTTLSPNAATLTQAQDPNTVRVDGSNIVSPILKAIGQAYTTKTPQTKVEVNVSGTEGGFDKLCSGAIDLTMAARDITDAQIAACRAKNVNFVELLLGYDALMVVVNVSSKATCLTVDQMNKLFGPGSTGVKNWNAVDPAIGDAAINNVYVTAPESQSYVLADTIIVGDKLRNDAQTLESAAKIAEKVSGEPTSVGLMTLTDYNQMRAAQSNLAIRALTLKTTATCLDATVPNLEEARYPAAETLYLYVNVASLDRQPVVDFMNYLLSREGRGPVTNTGFVAASDTTYDRGLNYIKNKQVGRTFSRIASVNVPPDTAGNITTDGSPAIFPIFKAVSDAFAPRYTGIKLTPNGYGNDAGYRNLCAGTAEIIGVSRLPTDVEATACQTANVQTLRVSLGAHAVVVLVNSNNKFAACLTTEQLGKLFSLDSENKVKKWSDVSAEFPATDLTILTPSEGVTETDLLLSKAIKAVAPVRRKDTVDNSDPLYRAAAVQNVEGGITYMTMSEFQQVKATVRAVPINAGNGCVEPTEANIKAGSYPLSQPLYLVFNLNAFSRPEIKAFVWYLLSDDALTIVSKQGVVATDTAGFATARETALERFQTTTGASATAAATGAATSVATATAPSAATPAATSAAPTTVATPAATAVSTSSQ